MTRAPTPAEDESLALSWVDILNDLRSATRDPEIKRMLSIAITDAQSAQMWAVKAITWCI
jgi:hypothetical protein